MTDTTVRLAVPEDADGLMEHCRLLHGEIWQPIAGYEDRYEVSNLGRVRSKERMAPTKGGSLRRLPEKIRATPTRRGYPSIILYDSGRNRRATVAHLVADAFIGPQPPDTELCHNDGDRANSRVDNLRYDTRAGNQADRKRHGTYGARRPNLKPADVREIRRKASFMSGLALAREYGLSQAAVSHILTGRNWSSLS